MKTVQLFFYAVIAAAVGYVIYRIFKLGDKVGDALSAIGQKIKDIASGAVQDVVDAHANVVNSVSGTFRSDAEKSVDDLYGPNQGWKTETVTRGKAGVGTTKKNVSVPAGPENLSPIGFNNPDWYNYGAAKNPPAGTVYDIPNAKVSDGSYPRAAAPVTGTNNASSNNDVIFEQMNYVY